MKTFEEFIGESKDFEDSTKIEKLIKKYRKEIEKDNDFSDFDNALKEYVLDYDDEGISSKKDLIDDFLDHAKEAGYLRN